MTGQTSNDIDLVQNPLRVSFQKSSTMRTKKNSPASNLQKKNTRIVNTDKKP